jgi:1,4-dihydroxy-2-naphthoyl-CoA hydrolase
MTTTKRDERSTASEMTGWAKAMGIELIRQSVEVVVADIAIGDPHRQAFGAVHGGVYCGLVETTASLGAWLVAQARGQAVVGLENSTSFIKATRSGVLRATAVPVTRGRQTQVWEATIRNDDGQIVATGRVRFLCTDSASVTGLKARNRVRSGEAFESPRPSKSLALRLAALHALCGP